MFTFIERKELNELSKEIFGKSSFWHKHIYKKGIKKTKDELTPQDTTYRQKRKWPNSFDELKAGMIKIKEATAKYIKDKPVPNE